MRTVIIDGYVDEPACFGVPPYISPYIRYIAGALRDRGISEDDIHYFTIDQLRTATADDVLALKSADLVVILSGMTVPGKYLRSSPITPGEIENICSLSQGLKVIGGPIRLGFSKEGGTGASELGIEAEDVVISKQDIEAFVYDLFEEGSLLDPDDINHRLRTVGEIGKWSHLGAFIIEKHPEYPYVMCELETYRGCGRKVHCSFCTERFYGPSDYRPVSDVIDEVSSLYAAGAKYFRIGRQPDLFGFHAKDVGADILQPDPSVLESLYGGIRKVAPDLQVLHMDNANPATIAAYPEQGIEIMKTIIRHHTSGDIAALGMESADPAVVSANDLKAMPEDVMDVIRMFNEVGASRGSNGLPELLPGLNFVHGLPGETKKTFDMNYDFLRDVLDSGLLVRRINIRQVMAFPGTRVYGNDELVGKHKKLFLKYKEKVRKEIDLPMLRKVVPKGTVLRDVMCEVHDESSKHDLTFGRQFGTYPLLVGIPLTLPLWKFTDVVITGHGQRSVKAIPYPLEINSAPLSVIKEIPGISDLEASEIYSGVPYANKNEILEKVSDVERMLDYIIV
ncbi:radical SAM protein [Methanococcoides methylutens]|uniref:radical SAM protein n=1 Tax=Methanococcoides methylutens TaxID=2226 RepID=UPI00064F75F6|nr:radical SAM protein [Methanococcoides methylutens]